MTEKEPTHRSPLGKGPLRALYGILRGKASTSVTDPIEEGGQSLQTVTQILDEQRRLVDIRRIGLIMSALTALTCVGYVVLFFQTGAWQVLGPAILLAAASGLFLGARSIARRGYLDLASYLMIGVILLLPSFALFWTGATQVLALGTAVLAIVLATLVLPRRQIVWAVLASLLGAGLTFLIDWVAPWPRFDVSQLILFRAFIIGTIAAAALTILWQLIRAYRHIGTIRIRLYIAFVSVVLLLATVIGAAVAVLGFQGGQRQVINQLEAVAVFKEVETKNWVRDSQNALANALNTEDMLKYLHWLIQEGEDSALRRGAHGRIQEHFQSLTRQQQIEELFLMDIQGEVVVSTDPTQEEKNFKDQTYFQEGLKGAHVQTLPYSPSLGEASVIFTRPVIDDQGHIFVLAVRASLEVFNETSFERIGLGETGETYLVDRNHAILTKSRFGGRGIDVRTQGANTAIESERNGSGLYENYRGQPVLGVYRWLPELQVALLVEQGQSEAFRPTYTMLGVIGGIALAAVLAAVAISMFLTRGIATPLASLAETAAQIAAGDLERSAEVEREDEIGALGQAFNIMTGQLRELISELEGRVADRTRDLEHRALQLQAAAEVGRAAASIRDLDELLSQVTHLISERFGYYHTGIFLLDEAGEYAVLRAANSEGGQRMLARGHKLEVGERGIVGYATGEGKPRIALDVGADAVYFDNPDMPDTRSEMALPLTVGGRVLGALDVQSTKAAAFVQEDIEVLQVLTDQVAVAIENARLFAETQEALETTRRAYGEMSRQAWEETLRARPDLGFRSDEHGVSSAEDVWRPEMERALREEHTAQGDGADSEAKLPLAVPIKVRGQVIGVLDTYKPGDAGAWTPEEIATLEEITEQLGASLESARLFEESIEERDRTTLLLEVSQRLSTDLDFDAVVDTVLSFAPRLGAEAAELCITDVEQETYFFKSSLPERATLAADEAQDFAVQALDQGLEGWVLRERQPTLVADTKLDDRWLAPPGHEEEEDPVRSVISVPVIAGRGNLQGVLSLTQRYPNAFDHDDVNLAMSLATQAAVAFENADLFQVTQMALEETDALYRASRAIAAADSMDDIVRAIVGSLTSPRIDQCFLGIFDSPGGKLSDDLIVVASWSQDADLFWKVGAQLSLNRDLMGERIKRDQPLIVSDVAAEEQLDEAKRSELAAADVRSLAIVPLVAVGGWIGVLSVTASRAGAITERNLQPYLTLAGQAALSIERSSLFKQTQEALEETSMLYRASRAIGAATSTPEVADVLLSSVAESDFDRGLVLIRRQADDKLETVAGWDRHGRPIEAGALMDVSQVSPDLTIYSDSIPDEAPPTQDEPWRQWVAGGEGATLASVPILFRRRVLGALLLESHHTDQLSEKVLQPFVTLAAQAAVAVENRRLFEETRRAADEEALLNEMLRDLATTLDMPSIIQTVQSSLAQLVSFDHISLALMNEEMQTLEVFQLESASSGPEHVLPQGQIFPLQETLMGQVIHSRETATFDLSDPSLQGLEIESLCQDGIQASAIIPMVYGRDVLGSLNLGHSRHDAYVTVDVPLLERVAQLAAIALENSRLFNQLNLRAVQLQTAAQVSQAATSILSLDQLLNQTAELIQDQFNLHYVGLFMVDEAGEWAVLRAGTGEAGRLQLKQGYRLKIDSESMIGWCVTNAQARVVLDVGEEATHPDDPFLPDTQSGLALPLVSRGEIIGALSVQSTSQAAFSHEDITTLQTMADQLANAIQNARLFEQTQKALSETESLYLASSELNTAQSYEDILTALRQHTMLGESKNVTLNLFDRPWVGSQKPEWVDVVARWGELPSEAARPRYSMATFSSWTAQLLRPDTPTLLGDIADDPRVDDKSREILLQRFGARSSVFAPLLVGGQWVGNINAFYQEPTTFSEPEVRRLTVLSAQAAVVAQGLRQLQEIRARARRESLIHEITSKVRASTDLEAILQTTVTEVSKALGTSHGAIRLGTEESLKADSTASTPASTLPTGDSAKTQQKPTSPPRVADAHTSGEAGAGRSPSSRADGASGKGGQE